MFFLYSPGCHCVLRTLAVKYARLHKTAGYIKCWERSEEVILSVARGKSKIKIRVRN